MDYQKTIGYALSGIGLAAIAYALTVYGLNSMQPLPNSQLENIVIEEQRKQTNPTPTLTIPTPVKKKPNRSPILTVEQTIESPYRLEIPKIRVNAMVEEKELSSLPPSGPWTVAWYSKGAKPGEKGNSVIAGHLNYVSGPAVFGSLHLLEPGDLIYVLSEKGNELAFEVYKMETYYDKKAPINEIYGAAEQPNLNLITCTGNFNPATLTYDQRLIVFSRLVNNVN